MIDAPKTLIPVPKGFKHRSNFRSLTGQKFARLTVHEYVGKNWQKNAFYRCVCDCGKECIVQGTNIKRGVSTSCGCYRTELHSNRRHANHDPRRSVKGVYSIEYKLWRSIKQRCLNPKQIQYKDYGGRGIKLCERWLDSLNFIKDIPKRPSPLHTFGRIDNDGNYEPGNVRWETRSEQQNNRRVCHYIEFNGETKTLTQWARHFGIKPRRLFGRVKSQWPFEKAIQPRNFTKKEIRKFKQEHLLKWTPKPSTA